MSPLGGVLSNQPKNVSQVCWVVAACAGVPVRTPSRARQTATGRAMSERLVIGSLRMPQSGPTTLRLARRPRQAFCQEDFLTVPVIGTPFALVKDGLADDPVLDVGDH